MLTLKSCIGVINFPFCVSRNYPSLLFSHKCFAVVSSLIGVLITCLYALGIRASYGHFQLNSVAGFEKRIFGRSLLDRLRRANIISSEWFRNGVEIEPF